MDTNRTLAKFILKLKDNKDLLNDLKTAADQDPENGAYNFALKHSEGNFSKEEFKNYLSDLSKQLQKTESQLNEVELENVSGGTDAPQSTFATSVQLFGHVVTFIGTIANIHLAYKDIKNKEQQRKDNELAIQAQKLQQYVLIQNLKNELKNRGYTDDDIKNILNN